MVVSSAQKDAFDELSSELESLSLGDLVGFRKSQGYLPVLGEGSLDADLLLIGEAPGETEALSGQPFKGRAGAILRDQLKHQRISLHQIFITSVVHDRPPNNRQPTIEEILLYRSFLWRLIEIIEPKVIGCLGKVSWNSLSEMFALKQERQFSQLLNQPFNIFHQQIPICLVPMYHPAAILYKRTLLPQFSEGIGVLGRLLEESTQTKPQENDIISQ